MIYPELYEQYRKEFSSRLDADTLTVEQFDTVFGPRLASMERESIIAPSERGVIHYSIFETEEGPVCNIPVFGYFASSEKVLSQLFIRLSKKIVRKETIRFQVHLYAHDLQARNLFSMMQFGYMAETGISKRDLPSWENPAAFSIRIPDKTEIVARWSEVWGMTNSIIEHLRQAPIFYPGKEFTEEIYKDFLTDEKTRLCIAFDQNGEMVGMIETNAEPNQMIRQETKSINVGEAYVIPCYRGTGLSKALLTYVLKDAEAREVKYLWVEHGTANPNARGFWGKYFDSYEYELDRVIKPL